MFIPQATLGLLQAVRALPLPSSCANGLQTAVSGLGENPNPAERVSFYSTLQFQVLGPSKASPRLTKTQHNRVSALFSEAENNRNLLSQGMAMDEGVYWFLGSHPSLGRAFLMTDLYLRGPASSLVLCGERFEGVIGRKMPRSTIFEVLTRLRRDGLVGSYPEKYESAVGWWEKRTAETNYLTERGLRCAEIGIGVFSSFFNPSS